MKRYRLEKNSSSSTDLKNKSVLFVAIMSLFISCNADCESSTMAAKDSSGLETSNESVRNELFQIPEPNALKEKLFHHIISKIDLSSHKIPKIAFCSVKKSNSSDPCDRTRFIKVMVAVVKWLNGELTSQRKFIKVIADKRKLGIPISDKENKKFKMICSFYRTNDIKHLLIKVAPVPVSMAVAQAVLESGFGSDSYMHRNNAFFGLAKDSTSLLSFNTIAESAIAYSKTLNVNPVYSNFRKERSNLISKNALISGNKLITLINKYSSTADYSSRIRKLIKEHELSKFDEVSV